MTHEDLVNYGYKPEDCKIGTLYFKGNLFCRLNNDVASVRTIQDDMTDIGKVSTIEELKKIEKDYLNVLIGHTKEWATTILKLFDHYEKSNENFIPNDKQNNEELIDKFEEWLNYNFTDRRDEWDNIDGVYCAFDSFNEMMENFEKTFKFKQ